jgi:hypothetical protein
MIYAILRRLALAWAGVLVTLSPLDASAQGFVPSPVPVDNVREALQAAGYAVGAPTTWGDGALVLEARAADGARVVRAFVYGDGPTVAAARRAAQMRSMNTSPVFSDDAGPQLLSGFGPSVWRRNVALVQSSRETFAELMAPVEDCGDLAPPHGPDLSRPVYQVDPAILELLDGLP